MSDKSSIEWTDATWNPVRGCTKISPGCKHCYAKTFAERFRGVPGHPYEQGFDLRLVPEKLSEPLKWKKPRKIFVNSMSDLFHPDVPDAYIVQFARSCFKLTGIHFRYSRSAPTEWRNCSIQSLPSPQSSNISGGGPVLRTENTACLGSLSSGALASR